jgi:hypothetical protein
MAARCRTSDPADNSEGVRPSCDMPLKKLPPPTATIKSLLPRCAFPGPERRPCGCPEVSLHSGPIPESGLNPFPHRPRFPTSLRIPDISVDPPPQFFAPTSISHFCRQPPIVPSFLLSIFRPSPPSFIFSPVRSPSGRADPPPQSSAPTSIPHFCCRSHPRSISRSGNRWIGEPIRSSIYALIHSFVHFSIHSFRVHSFIYSSVPHSFTRSFVLHPLALTLRHDPPPPPRSPTPAVGARPMSEASLR